MKKVAIMTDTISDMTQEIADKHNIKVLPLYVVIEGKSHPETEIDLAWYYKQIPQWKEVGKLPTSSSVPPTDFLEAYRELSQKAEAILYVAHSSKLGMSPNAALEARKMAEEELPQAAIEVIDSGTACGAQMLIALEAARAGIAGKSFPEVVEVANNMVKRVNLISLFDDLYYLSKGGRIHKARPWAASQISNTALLELDASTGGEVTPLARYRTKGDALEKLFETVKERCGSGKLHVAINHADALVEAEELKKIASSRFPCAEVYITAVLPAVTLQTGVGTRHFSWWSED